MTHRAVKPHVHIPYDSIDNYLEFIKEEKLNLEIYFGSRRFDDLDDSAIRKLKQKLDYNPELTIHAPFMDLSPGAVDARVRDVTIKRFTDIIHFSEILKPKAVVFHSGYDKWKYDSRVDIWLEGSLITWGIVNKIASDAGIKVAIENIFEKEPSSLRLLMEEMNSGNFGVCFDAGHFNLFSAAPLPQWIFALKPYIIELHLHDNDRTADLHRAIGDGTFDFNLLFDGLSGRECIYTIEAHTIEDVRKSMLRLKDHFGKDGR